MDRGSQSRGGRGADQPHYELIVPCGIQDKAVTSISAELGRTIGVPDVADPLARHFAELYDAEVEWRDALPGDLSL